MFNKKTFIALLIGISTFSILFVFKELTIIFVGLENSYQRFLFYYREPSISLDGSLHNHRVDQDSHIIGIDEKSLAIVGKWPWPRDTHASLVQNVQQFSPKFIFIDMLFINPETMPDSLERRIAKRTDLQQTISALYQASDMRFASELQKHDNVFIDQMLLLKRQSGLPQTYQERIMYNEETLQQLYSEPAKDYDVVYFRGLEPIITPFLDNAHPVTINVWPDNDSVLRSFTFLHTYETMEQKLINVYSVAISLLMEYYKISHEQLLVEEDKIVLQGAYIPHIDPKTKQKQKLIVSVEQLNAKTSNQKEERNTNSPKTYRYNTNLYQYLVNYSRMNAFIGEELLYDFPVYVDEQDQIIDGWEIFDAAIDTGIKNVHVVVCSVDDLVIPTRKSQANTLHNYFINYSGRQERSYQDPFSKNRKIHHTIATSPYYKPYTKPSLPELPAIVDENGTLKNDVNTSKLSKWFVQYTQKKIGEIQDQVLDFYGSVSYENIVEFSLEHDPYLGKYFFYDIYFQNGGSPLDTAFYIAFMKDLSQQENIPISAEVIPTLTHEQMALSLQEAYREGFETYYNKSIFVGMRAFGVAHDVHETPYGQMYGINVIANAFSTIVTNNNLEVASFRYNFLFLLLFCIIGALVHRFLTNWLNLTLFFICLIGILIYTYIAFSMSNMIVETIPVTAANVLILIVTILYKIGTEERDRKFLKSTFSSYLSPELIDEMFHSKTMPALGGETRIVTAFFTDIQGFSTFSEKLTAQQLVELLNEYLAEMTEILTDEKGTLDKYEGDAIIAFIGAPMEIPSHSFNACKIAIKMQKKLEDLKNRWMKETYSQEIEHRNTKNIPLEEWAPGEKWPKIVHKMRMRIGINTGEIVVGNMGSQMRMNYTMMGDAVNLAARLEAAAKQYGMYTMISEATLNHSFQDENGETVFVRDVVECRFLDKLVVVGRSEPVKVYELIALKNETSPKEKKLIKTFQKGIDLYMKMEWSAARDVFKETELIETYKDGKITPSSVFINRCKQLKATPPVAKGEKWDGVWRLSEK